MLSTVLTIAAALLGGWLIGLAIRLHNTGRAGTTPEQAWDNGCQHGLRLAHDLITKYPKPWINYGEERGWDLARNQLRDELGHLLDEQTHPNESNPTASQASSSGVSQ